MTAHHDLVLPVSVKGILGPPGQVVLLRNERGEWELPGGRLDPADPTPEACVEREIAEELDLAAAADRLVHAWRYEPVPGRHVFVAASLCRLQGPWPDRLWHSDEHDDVGVFGLAELADLDLPQGYRDALDLAGLRG